MSQESQGTRLKLPVQEPYGDRLDRARVMALDWRDLGRSLKGFNCTLGVSVNPNHTYHFDIFMQPYPSPWALEARVLISGDGGGCRVGYDLEGGDRKGSQSRGPLWRGAVA